MTITAPQQTALESPVIRIGFFADFDFLTANVYVTTLPQTVTWGGHDWIGVGSLGNISSINESLGVAAESLTFTLNVAQIEYLAIATGDVIEYRGRDAKLYFCPLDENFNIIDTPVVCWRGSMDMMSVSISGDRGDTTGSIQLKCETSAYGLKRKSPLRLNAAQHKQKYQTDTGLDYLTDLLGNPDSLIWLSKKFQS